MFGNLKNSRQCHLDYKSILQARLEDPMIKFFYSDLQALIHSQQQAAEVRNSNFQDRKSLYVRAKADTFSVFSPNSLAMLNQDARLLYVAIKEYIDEMNIIKLNQALIKRFKVMAKDKYFLLETLTKRLITMFLPFHNGAISYMKPVLKNCMLVEWMGRPALLYHGPSYYPMRDKYLRYKSLKTCCLLRMPRVIEGKITFKCVLPFCKASLELIPPSQSSGKATIGPCQFMHTCLHNSMIFRPTMLLHPERYGGDLENWFPKDFLVGVP